MMTNNTTIHRPFTFLTHAIFFSILQVKLISSDASQNIPFQITASSIEQGNVALNFNTAVTITTDENHTIVKIPKSLKGQVKVADYRILQESIVIPMVSSYS